MKIKKAKSVMSAGISGFFSSSVQGFEKSLKKQSSTAPVTSSVTTSLSADTPVRDQSQISSQLKGMPRQAVKSHVNLIEPEFIPLSDLRSAAEALEALRQRGFINGPAGRETYQYECLSDQKADILKQLHTLFRRDSQATGSNHDALQFALHITGATLRDPRERSHYLQTNLLNSRDAEHLLNQMVQVLKFTSDPHIAQALQNSLAQASTRQTVNLLYKTGFLKNDGLEENGPSIRTSAIQHLPQPVIDQIIKNLNKGGIFNPHAPIIQALKHLR